MNVRRATDADEQALRALWEEFEHEVPEPPGVAPETWEEEWSDVLRDMAGGAVYLAEDDEGVIGTARATAPKRGDSHLHLVHVRPRARRRGVAKALVRACAHDVKAAGATRMSLDVLVTNTLARMVWLRLGFDEETLVMVTPIDALERRLAETPSGPSRASLHVQSDDRDSVDRALAQFVPRLAEPSLGVAANGWVRIADPVIDDHREARERLSRELSHRLGAVVVALAVEGGAVVRLLLFERGRMVDEYLSVPSWDGELSKGDELARQVNATLVSRLTGADRDEVRRVARTAASPADLPPPDELYAMIARTMGLEP